MELSKYTIFSKLKDSKNWFILNLLTEKRIYWMNQQGHLYREGSFPILNHIGKRAISWIPMKRQNSLKPAIWISRNNRKNPKLRYFMSPTYQCNFACTYCYQESYENPPREQQLAVMDSFFSYLDNNFAGKPFYVTLFGGEPLLPDKLTQEYISYFLDEADKRSISLAIVTNGYSLDSYLDRLKKSNIREIQITLDGVGELHDIRRPLKGGQATF